MKTILTILILGAASVFMACRPQSNENVAEDPVETDELGLLEREVMKVHDEVMPKMNDLYRARKSVEKMIGDSATLDSAQATRLRQLIREIDSADQGMRVWMRQFNPDVDSLTDDRKREYLETEMEKIKRVREAINEALLKTEGAGR